MSKSPSRDEVLARMLKTPPKPFTPKAKKAPGDKKKPKKFAPEPNPYLVVLPWPLGPGPAAEVLR